MREALRRHWPEYLIEAAGLGTFMVSAALFATLLEHPDSPVRHAIDAGLVRRALMGVAMGLTAIGIIYSPWGQRSGAHLNPAVTLTFWRLGKVETADALFYVAAQFAGGALGIALASVAIAGPIAHPTINYVATLPGPGGRLVAFAAELVISFGLMLAVLWASNHRRLTRYTGLLAGTLVAAYILVEAPLSGMSMNPARSFGSALSAQLWTGLWIYFTAPLLGMLLAARAYRSLRSAGEVYCAKLHHHTEQRCIFRCNFGRLLTGQDGCA